MRGYRSEGRSSPWPPRSAVAVGGAASAAWTSGGGGTGGADTGALQPIALSSGTPASPLFPGGQTAVRLTVTNPNDANAKIGSIALDTSQGSGGFAVDAGHVGCALSALSFTTQTNGGAGWALAPASGGDRRNARHHAAERPLNVDERRQRVPGCHLHDLPGGGTMTGAPRHRSRGSRRARWSRSSAAVAAALVVTMGAGSAWAYWTPTSLPGGSTAAAATTVGAGATPTAVATGGSVAVSWAASTLADGSAVGGYTVTRYNAADVPQVVGGSCAGLVTATTCTETGVTTGTWTYSITPRIATNWIGAESAKSAGVAVDAIPPTNAITLNRLTGGAVMSGTTVYYRGVASGSFTLTNALTDANSGPASSATAALTGTTTGWTHTPSTVTTPTGGPYVSHAFSWGAGTTSSPVELVTGADVGGSTAGTSLTFVNDSTPPTAGTITYLDGYQPARSVPVTFAAGTDSGSGVAARKLQRSYAALSGGTCGAFSNFYDIGGPNPASPYTDTAVYTGWCYKYQYVVTDAVGNAAIATSAAISKVDYGGAVSITSGLVSWWRFGEAPITSTDRFIGTRLADLASHTADDGTTWTLKDRRHPHRRLLEQQRCPPEWDRDEHLLHGRGALLGRLPGRGGHRRAHHPRRGLHGGGRAPQHGGHRSRNVLHGPLQQDQYQVGVVLEGQRRHRDVPGAITARR